MKNDNYIDAESDSQCEDIHNFKGIYYDNPNDQHYTDPQSGAHFQYADIYRKLEAIRIQRNTLTRSKSNARKSMLPDAVISQNRVTSMLITQKINECKLKKEIVDNYILIRRRLDDKQFHKTINAFNSITTVNKGISPRDKHQFKEPRKFIFGKESNALYSIDKFNFVSMDLRKGRDLQVSSLYKEDQHSPLTNRNQAKPMYTIRCRRISNKPTVS